jgi:hypothetical protein
MTTPPSSEFSYDLYPGLDDELQAALERNIANGTAGLAEIATAGLAAAVAEHAAGPNLNTEWSSLESLLWCTNELSSARESWLDYWRKYAKWVKCRRIYAFDASAMENNA